MSKSADGCAGTARLAAFRIILRRIDDQAGNASPDYSRYTAAVGAGNRWLSAVGYRGEPLSLELTSARSPPCGSATYCGRS